MRLIDADYITGISAQVTGNTDYDNGYTDGAVRVLKAVKNAPTILIERQDALDAIYACHVDGKRIKRLSKSECLPDSFTSGILEAISAVEDVPSVGQWIPCAERLPDENGWYLISMDYGDIAVAYFKIEYGWLKYKAIAWRPLPEPYEPPKEVET